MRVAGHLHVVRGARLAESVRMKEFVRTRRGERERLFVLIQPQGPRADDTCQRVLQVLEREFQNSHASLTSMLTRGFMAVHRRLREENERSLMEHRVGASATAVVVRSDAAVLALTGGATAVAVRAGQIVVFGEPAGRSLGADDGPMVQLHRLDDEQGNSLLMSSAPLMPGMEEQELVDLFAHDDRPALELLRQMANPNATFSAVLLRASEAEPLSAGAAPTHLDGAQQSVSGGTQHLPGARMMGTSGSRKGISGWLGTLSRPAAGKPARTAGRQATGGQEVSVQSRRMVARAGQSDRSPAAPKSARLPRLSMETMRIVILIALVFITLAFVAMLAYVVPQQAQQQIEASALRTFEQAEQTRLKALLESDRDTQRQLLNEADKLVASVATVKAVESKVASLRMLITADLNALNAVHELIDLESVAPESAFNGGVSDIRAFVVSPAGLLVLADGRIHVLKLAEDGRSLSAPISTVLSPIAAPPAVWMAWVPTGGGRQAEGLVVIDEQRQLWEWSSGDSLQRTAVRSAESWRSMQSIRGYNGNLYVLDAQASQVLRYPPAAGGYDSEFRGILEQASIADAIDFTIDGDIYVLTPDRVWRFTGGRGIALALTGLDRPFTDPSMIYATNRTHNVYIADTGNNRVVVLDKEGQFIRQLAAPFPVRAVQVDEIAGHLYIAGPTGIYVAALPH